MASKIIRSFQEVNKELWLLLTMFAILGLVNFLMESDRVLLGLYTLPVLFSAYYYGRRHATLTAMGAMLMVILVTRYNPSLFSRRPEMEIVGEKWFEIVAWGGTLMVTAYAMGTLYERTRKALDELRQTYHGVLMILRHFISKDKYTENHSYRVSIYATKIAAYLGFKPERIEDVRCAALLHDIGKLDISRDLLHKAGRLTKDEFSSVQEHVEKGAEILDPLGGSMRRIIPIILAHHDKFDGSGHSDNQGEEIPLEARVISVADVYDALTSDRPYRKGMAPFEAREIIEKGSGKDFDPEVVAAFLRAFNRRELEVPEVMVA